MRTGRMSLLTLQTLHKKLISATVAEELMADTQAVPLKPDSKDLSGKQDPPPKMIIMPQ